MVISYDKLSMLNEYEFTWLEVFIKLNTLSFTFVKLMVVILQLYTYNYLVIEAQIPAEEDLRTKESIQFPTINTLSNDSLVLSDRTPMIEIPTTIVLRELEEGAHMYNSTDLMQHHVCM